MISPVIRWDHSDTWFVPSFQNESSKEGYENIRCYCTQGDYNLDFEKPSEELERQINLDLVFNVHQNGSWGCYCNLSVSHKDLGKPRSVTESFVNTLHPGDLSAIQWIESPLKIKSDENNLCSIHYSSLNFRDVMLVTGKLSKDALPGDLAFQDCVLGIEFAGESNGKFVCGMRPAKCLATSVEDHDSGFLLDVPDKWSLAEAATVPAAYGTAYYALLVRGKMKKGETVLIHAGSGGVGQAAIAIALSTKCKVITTVSTTEKRQFLRNRFPELDDSSFTDSRNASVFENFVMNVTNGRGVDIVLNSLTQDKLEASVRCLAKYGRFLEIGKFDLFNNTALGMEIFLRSVNFQGILLDDVLQGPSEDKEKVEYLIRAGIESGVVIPLPHVLFSNNQLEEAFRFMATGKHMGKVVISIRDDSPSGILSLPRTYFYSQKSYVLVGGLGGMGMEIANWMVSRGARNLVFISRSGLSTGYQAYRVKVWRDQGVNVIIDNSDVSTQSGAQTALNLAVGVGPVGGIFNLALVLTDAMFPNQTAEHFEIVSKAKILATIELDRASRNLEPKLDYFVCFSSIASSKGNAGQTSYGFANSFMDRLCEERSKIGLPGLAIQWGAIGDVGVLHNLMGGKDVDVAGVAPQKIASCLEMFDLFLNQSHPVMSSFVPVSRIASKDEGTQTLTGLVAHILAIKNIAKVKMGATLIELGMDSLMATEIKILLEDKKGISLPATSIGQLTFSNLVDLKSNELNLNEESTALEFKQITLLHLPLAFEIAIQLERQGESVENLVLLDGCHKWPKFFAQTFIERDFEKDDVAWLIYFLFLHMSSNWKKAQVELSSLSEWDERLNKTAELLCEVYPTFSLDELRDLATAFSDRLRIGYEYEPSTKVKAPTTLIRAGKAGFDKKLGNDYELNQVCETPVNVLVMDGRHHCFYERPLELDIPKMINDIFTV
ncbi:unnamed protein product [Allacma fusca]|uniref:Carrier domain-containing protein n=1 Tax=Allacma fusca TaxID=39272 RepID=A0A8J2M1G1_9HEXA|nr:unnamed protein product [Allacma fusca]